MPSLNIQCHPEISATKDSINPNNLNNTSILSPFDFQGGGSPHLHDVVSNYSHHENSD